MAIVQNPFTGRTSGKFAGAVFSKQFGKNTMRSKPVSVKNPQTVAQMSQRMKFSMMVVIARLMLSFIRVSFKTVATSMSAFNVFVQDNIKIVFAGVYPNYTIDFTKLIVAKGTLTGLDTPAAAAAAGNEIDITWIDNSGQGDALASDKLMYVFINETIQQIVTNTNGAIRSAATKTVVVPVAWVGDDVSVYVAMSDDDVTKIADSQYVGQVTIIA